MIMSVGEFKEIFSGIKIKPQEQKGNSKFKGATYVTRGFIHAFGEGKSNILVSATLDKIHHEQPEADYLQVCEFKDITFWVIDETDYAGNITFLLPEEY